MLEPSRGAALLRPPTVESTRLLSVPAATAEIVNARQPFIAGPLEAAAPFYYQGSADARARALDCLAAAAWYEAGDDSSGQKAVMQVVVNRVRHPAFPKSICGVVFQGADRPTGCQFTFTCDGSLNRVPSASAWARAEALAAAVFAGSVDPRVGYATHYHTEWVLPQWRTSLDKVAQVGPHLFYRWKGYWGQPNAFLKRLATTEPAEAQLAFLSTAHAQTTEVLGADAASPVVPEAAAAAPATVVPVALVVEGVPEKSLRDAQVRARSPDGDRFFVQVDPSTFPGSYATAALALCKSRPRCEVFGWADPQQLATHLPLTGNQKTALTFYYRSEGQGMEVALWNCDEVKRTDARQCLPQPSMMAALLG